MIFREKDIIEVSSNDDFLYSSIMSLLSDIKLSQGPAAVESTLRRHSEVFNYIMSKQKNLIFEIKSCFNDDGSICFDAVDVFVACHPHSQIINQTIENLLKV